MTEQQRIKNLNSPQLPVDVILDTDAYNEIDDQFAISYLLKNSDKLSCIGLCAAPFLNGRSVSPKDGMEKSFEEIKRLLKLIGREDVPVFSGSEDYLKDESTPQISPASRFIAEKAKEYSPEKPLYVVAIGAITNVASAILLAEKAAENIVVVWLGGHARQTERSDEFNMMQDYSAARVVMSSPASFVQLPCLGVVDVFHTNEPELREELFSKTPLSHYLAENTVKYCNPTGERRIWSKVIWDVTAIGWLLNENGKFMEYFITDTYLPDKSGKYEKAPINKKMCYVIRIYRDNLMKDLFKKITE